MNQKIIIIMKYEKSPTFDWSCCCSNCSLSSCSCRIISDSLRSFSAKLSAQKTLCKADAPSCCTCPSVFCILPDAGGEGGTLFATLATPPLQRTPSDHGQLRFIRSKGGLSLPPLPFPKRDKERETREKGQGRRMETRRRIEKRKREIEGSS